MADFNVSTEFGVTRPSHICLDGCCDKSNTRYNIMHELDTELVRLSLLDWIFDLTWSTRLGYTKFSYVIWRFSFLLNHNKKSEIKDSPKANTYDSEIEYFNPSMRRSKKKKKQI